MYFPFHQRLIYIFSIVVIFGLTYMGIIMLFPTKTFILFCVGTITVNLYGLLYKDQLWFQRLIITFILKAKPESTAKSTLVVAFEYLSKQLSVSKAKKICGWLTNVFKIFRTWFNSAGFIPIETSWVLYRQADKH